MKIPCHITNICMYQIFLDLWMDLLMSTLLWFLIMTCDKFMEFHQLSLLTWNKNASVIPSGVYIRLARDGEDHSLWLQPCIGDNLLHTGFALPIEVIACWATFQIKDIWLTISGYNQIRHIEAQLHLCFVFCSVYHATHMIFQWIIRFPLHKQTS